MTATDPARRERRAAGQAVLDGLAEEYLGCNDVDRAAMFGSSALRVHDKVFAFVGADGELIIKLPADDARELVEAGNGTPVKIGRNPAREWVAVDQAAGDEPDPWRDLIAASYAHVRSTARPIRSAVGRSPARRHR